MTTIRKFVYNMTSPVWYPWRMSDRDLPMMAGWPVLRTTIRLAVTVAVALASYALLAAMVWGAVHFLRGYRTCPCDSTGLPVEHVRIAETNRSSYSNGYDIAVFKADCDMPISDGVQDNGPLIRGIGELFADLNLMTFAGFVTSSNRMSNAADGVEWARTNFFAYAENLNERRRREDEQQSWTESVAEMSLEGRVVWSDERCVSYRIRSYSYFGGAHPDVQIICGVLDRRTGRRLRPEDFIREECLGKVLNVLRRSIAKGNPDSEVLRELAEPDNRPYEEVRRVWQEEQADYLKGAAESAPILTDNFLFEANGVTWVFMEYQISGGMDGCPSGTVSWEAMDACMVEGWKVAESHM